MKTQCHLLLRDSCDLIGALLLRIDALQWVMTRWCPLAAYVFTHRLQTILVVSVATTALPAFGTL